jgi:wobble nucleotide-excising tRNase
MARLDHDSRLKDKVVVLDDPMCSMDRDRSDQTVKMIVELAGKAKQVLS